MWANRLEEAISLEFRLSVNLAFDHAAADGCVCTPSTNLKVCSNISVELTRKHMAEGSASFSVT